MTYLQTIEYDYDGRADPDAGDDETAALDALLWHLPIAARADIAARRVAFGRYGEEG